MEYLWEAGKKKKKKELNILKKRGDTCVFVAIDKVFIASLIIADSVKEEKTLECWERVVLIKITCNILYRFSHLVTHKHTFLLKVPP